MTHTHRASNQLSRALDAMHCVVIGGAMITAGLLLVTGADAKVVSHDENRRLASAPELTADAVIDGSYAEGVDAYVSDHFPARDALLATNVWLRDHRGFRGADQPTFYAVDLDARAVAGSFALADEAIDHDEVESFELRGGEIEELEVVMVEEEAESSAEAGDGDDVKLLRGVFVHDGRGMQIFGGSAKGSRGWADAVNAYHTALPDVRLVAAMIPSSQEFYLPESARNQGRRERPNIEATYARLASGVHKADVIGELAAHTDEYIYFRTDHHWTGLGAYHGYRAVCAALGFDPVALDDMTAKTNGTFRGSLARLTKDPSLVDHPDTVEYWVPPIATTATRYARLDSKGVEKSLLRENAWAYGVFLGGDFPIIRVTTSLQNGRRGVLVKNSQGNPLAVYLASHFEELYIVDYRYFKDTIVDLVAQKSITDVVILMGTHTANTPWQVRRVRKVLDGKG
jgi:hypothetical protein